jgi:hypothetical protein
MPPNRARSSSKPAPWLGNSIYTTSLQAGPPAQLLDSFFFADLGCLDANFPFWMHPAYQGFNLVALRKCWDASAKIWRIPAGPALLDFHTLTRGDATFKHS